MLSARRVLFKLSVHFIASFIGGFTVRHELTKNPVSYPVESKSSLGHGGLSRGGPDGLQGGIQLPLGAGSVAHQLRDAGNLASLGDGPGGMDIDEVEGFNPFSINLSGFQVDTDDGSIEPQLLDMLGVVLTMQTTLIQVREQE